MKIFSHLFVCDGCDEIFFKNCHFLSEMKTGFRTKDLEAAIQSAASG